MFYKTFYNLIIATTVLSATFLFVNKSWAADDMDIIFDVCPIVEDTHLDEIRGAALNPELLGIAIFDAVSLNNSTSGTYSGGNVIDEGAFSDSSGLSTIIQNSGNNVLIQSATILNLSID